MALTRLNGVNAITGTIPQGNIANASLGAVTALPTGLGGKVLQVVQATDGTEKSTTNTSFQDTSLSVNITPSSTSNKILIIGSLRIKSETASGGVNADVVGLALFADSSNIFELDTDSRTGIQYYGNNGSGGISRFQLADNLTYLHSPSSTSQIAYSIKIKTRGTHPAVLNPNNCISSITAFEIGA